MRGALVTSRLSIMALPIILRWLRAMVIIRKVSWESFKHSMHDGEFVFNVSRELVSRRQTPLLVLMGNDLHHPQSTSRELAALAPNATFIEHWKEPEHHATAKKAVEDFLAAHTPR